MSARSVEEAAGFQASNGLISSVLPTGLSSRRCKGIIVAGGPYATSRRWGIIIGRLVIPRPDQMINILQELIAVRPGQ